MSDEELYDRQTRLREVGDAGQARILASQARIAARAGATVELAYLVRAGVPRGEIVSGAPAAFADAGFFRYAGPRSVADGAQAALAHLLRSLNSR